MESSPGTSMVAAASCSSITPVSFSYPISSKLDDNNYLVWQKQVVATIRGHRLEHFLFGSAPPKFLTPDDAAQGKLNSEFLEWEQQDQLIVSWLLASMSDGVATLTVNSDSASQIWSTLEENYDHSKMMNYSNINKGQGRETMDVDLYKAASKGNSTKLKQLVQGDPNKLRQVTRAKNDTVLHVVAISGDLSSAEFIFEQCKDLIQKINIDGDTALHIAARAGHINLLKFLIEWARGHWDLEASQETNRDGEVPARAGHFNLMKFLTGKARQGFHQAASHVNNTILEVQNKDDNTVLHEIVGRGDSKTAKFLTDIDPKLVGFVNKKGKSPLLMATARGFKEIVLQFTKMRDILESANIKGPKGQTPVHVAAARGDAGLVEILLHLNENWAAEVDNNGRTPLYYAVSHDHPLAASLLLQRDRSCGSEPDNSGDYPIHVAASRGLWITLTLVKCCPDMTDHVNAKGQNALHVAAEHGRENVVAFFLSNSRFEIMVNVEDKSGNTPLHLATMGWHAKTVSLLTQHKGINAYKTNAKDLTAMDIAEKKKDTLPISFSKLMILTSLREALKEFEPDRVKYMQKKKIGEQERNKEHYKDRMNNYKDRVNTFSVVATLILTVTFAVGFTIPGGYYSDGPEQGTAILLTKPSFLICVIFNILAMYTSIIIIIFLMWAQTSSLEALDFAMKICTPALGIALISMAIAFAAGVFSVVSKLSWLAALVLVIGVIFIILISIIFFSLHVLLWTKSHLLLFVSQPLIRFIVYLGGNTKCCTRFIGCFVK